MHWNGWGCPPGAMFGLAIFWIVLLAGVALLGMWLWQQLSRRGLVAGPFGDDPVRVLKRRYAAGEIPREEFERMRKDLE